LNIKIIWGNPVELKHEDRRLTTILAADVAGYSRLMAADEAGTVARLKAHRKELIEPKSAEYHGRIVKLMGDGVLMEFGSVIDAVNFAIDVQQVINTRNSGVPDENRIVYRIGINIGDIIVDGKDLYGDGVNIAARLEQLAEPGGICIAGNVFKHVQNKVIVDFEDMGEQQLKNIPDAIHAYKVLRSYNDVRSASLDTDQPLRIPDKPSIAVLPFDNMSGDPEQEYFADGISEDLITALSRLRWLLVIARNSSFVYKGTALDLRQVSRELGVRYVLEGSVRKAGNRVRVTAQLIDATNGNHIWADKYDREIEDIFTLQDEITQSVTAAIEPKLIAAEGLRSTDRHSQDLDAWGLVARAMSRFWHVTGPDVEAAIDQLKEAVQRYPEYAPAHSMLAFCLVLTGHFGWLPIYEVPQLALESARRAIELDDNDPWAYLAMGYVAFVRRQTDDAAGHFARATQLNPNFAAAHGYWGYALSFDGRSDEAIERMSLAMRMSPHDRQNSIYMGGMAVAHYLAKRYDEAVMWARKAVQQGPSMTAPHRILCASLAQAGHGEEARRVLERVREMQPYISVEWVERMVPYTPTQLPHFVEGLKKAGLS
jgi:adenylate cyclase